MNEPDPTDEWERAWLDRTTTLERIFGPMEPDVGHSPVPFDLGPEAGGGADVVYFRRWCPGILAVTCELLGRSEQVPNSQGSYELAICQRDGEAWGPGIISRLAHYTLEAALDAGETMSIGSAVPPGSAVQAFLFQDIARTTFRGQSAGVLLCIGITADELEACRAGRTEDVLAALQAQGVFPFTDLRRSSVLAVP
jgi:Suppressor of fused protein (SUFU)